MKFELTQHGKVFQSNRSEPTFPASGLEPVLGVNPKFYVRRLSCKTVATISSSEKEKVFMGFSVESGVCQQK